MRNLGILSLILCIIVGVKPVFADDFDIPPPNSSSSAAKRLWATRYNVHLATPSDSPDAVPLVAADNQLLGVSLSPDDWCDSALEGTVTVTLASGSRRTFNVGGMALSAFTDCTGHYSSLDLATRKRLGRMEFFEVPADAPFGLGARPSYRLVPFRSIAVDREVFRLGTVFFIPRLRGKAITLPDGSVESHDGYVMAVDTGGAIKGNHIDIFTGVFLANPFPDLVRSSPAHRFDAFVVTQQDTVEQLLNLHRR